MTKGQRITLMADWWPAACAAQRWSPNDRAKRLEVLSQAVGRFLASANDLNNSTDIDLVKGHLLTLSRPADLDTQIAQVNMPITRLKYAIARLAPPAYTAAIMRDRFHTTDLDDLTPEQLTQLRNTLAARKKKPNNFRTRANEPVPLVPHAAPESDEGGSDNQPF